MKLYKLTNEHGLTYNNTEWGVGIRHEITGDGERLCADGWLYAYEDPNLAVLFNPIHAAFPNPQLWLAEGEEPLYRTPLKVGVKALTTTERLPLPIYSETQKIAFAILCAMEVTKNSRWLSWATGWLSDIDRSLEGAEKAAADAWEAWVVGEKTWTGAMAAKMVIRPLPELRAAATAEAATAEASLNLAAIARRALEY